MEKQYITVAGRTLRVECNWRAITAYLSEKGLDTMDGMSDLANIRPSTLPPLMAACVNEGERLDGKEAAYTGEWFAENCSMSHMHAFLLIYNSQTAPQVPAEKN